MLKGIPQPRRADLTARALAFQNPRLPIPLRVVSRLPFARVLWPLDAAALKAKARRRTRLRDFGGLAPLDEPLGLLCRALEEDAQMHALGRWNVHSALLSALSHRLRLEDLARRRPHVFERPVPPPTVIAGLPGSGATFLQRLLARDPATRWIPFWESVNPLPPATPVPAPDPRVKAGARMLSFLQWSCPETIKMFELENESACEETMPLAMGFAATFLEMCPLPGYLPWHAATDHTAGYAYLRRTLQAMQWGRPEGERWLLRSSQHLAQFGPLTAAFPDGTVVQTHRDPVGSVLALSAMLSYAFRQNFRHPNPHLIGHYVTEQTERLLRAAIRDRSPVDRRFVDVHFAQLNADPMGTVRRIYAAAGAELSEETERLMTVWYPRHRRGRHGVHSYEPADFGLSVPALRERFTFYYDHFAVPREGH
ncbi:putative sulfotransferase [Acrocarpospora phusangensis]|uniref:Sulfotransferase n=1 Tax=Acrocarpospora phusangensis TaxID=1070424 RepID=A0A919QH53_9ACTN|nr:sulfotransferase [Acrocarpospora phusangensis]GIH27478.1 putative sulfotransferase [Acrocarpospora phusangensis]